MPIYVFTCGCGNKFELNLPMPLEGNLPTPYCPECGKLAKRIYTPFNFKMNFEDDKKGGHEQ